MPGITKWVRFLLIFNFVIWLATFLLDFVIRGAGVWIFQNFGLVLSRVWFEPWQLVTYNFLHLSPGLNGLLHVLFNMLWLVWIGREYEYTYGAHKLTSLYVLAGVGGGLLSVVLHALFPGVGAFSGP